MLREYIISEAMHALGIPTTRSLAVVTTGEHTNAQRMIAAAEDVLGELLAEASGGESEEEDEQNMGERVFIRWVQIATYRRKNEAEAKKYRSDRRKREKREEES